MTEEYSGFPWDRDKVEVSWSPTKNVSAIPTVDPTKIITPGGIDLTKIGIPLPKIEIPDVVSQIPGVKEVLEQASVVVPGVTAPVTAEGAKPVVVTSVDPANIGKEVTGAIAGAIQQGAGALSKEVTSYVIKGGLQQATGQNIDMAKPTVTVTTSTGTTLKVADAKNRFYRTFLQGLALDIMFAMMALLGTITNLDPLSKASWLALGLSVLKTILQACVSYVSRIRFTPEQIVGGEQYKILPLAVPKSTL